ncbi:MAG: thiamine phosphate synthase [Acidobacteriota bacterium]|nr:thiamine phosphate synthase [Acidobacteriota bacterium]
MDIPLHEIGLHLVTAPAQGGRAELLRIVDASIDGGLRLVQHRDKECATRAAMCDVQELVALCRPRGVLVIVNDRIDVALATGADGVHLGPDDLDWQQARRLAPPPFILGCTAAVSELVREAIACGADYAGAGPAHPTTTKRGAGSPLEADDFRKLRSACRSRGGAPLPLVAVGGVEPGKAAALIAAGATAVAVSAAIMRAGDPRATTRKLVEEVETARFLASHDPSSGSRRHGP